MTVKHWFCAVSVVWIAGACSSDKPAGGLPTGGASGSAGAGDAATGGTNEAGAGAGAGGDGGNGYRVVIAAERTSLCAGECVELSAEASNGRAPYRYVWSNDLGEGPGPHHACPEETTTYSVVASDTASDAEFGNQSEEASASIEIRVDEDCDGPDGGVPPEGTVELCSARIESSGNNWLAPYGTWDGNSSVATDAEGNFYVTGAFQGTFEIGEHTITSVGMVDGFVIKYDPSCKPLWAKSYGAIDQVMEMGSIAVAPDGELAVGGLFRGAVDFGHGRLTSGINGSAFLMKIDGADGTVLWNQAYVSFLYSAWIWDIGIDSTGDIVFSGYAAADVSFGGPAIGGSTGNISFVAKLSGDGAHRFSFAIPDTDLILPIAVHPSGVIALTGASSNTSVSINGSAVALSGANWKRYAALLDASGTLLWGHELDEPDEWNDDQFRGYWGTGIAIDADRNVVVEHGQYNESSDGTVQELPERLSKLDSAGTPLWSKDFTDGIADELIYGEGGLAVDSHRNIIHSDEATDPSTVTPEAQQAGITPHALLFVRKLTPEGDVMWRHVFAGATLQWTWGIATGPDDAVWIARGEEEVIDDSVVNDALVVTKLAP